MKKTMLLLSALVPGLSHNPIFGMNPVRWIFGGSQQETPKPPLPVEDLQKKIDEKKANALEKAKKNRATARFIERMADAKKTDQHIITEKMLSNYVIRKVLPEETRELEDAKKEKKTIIIGKENIIYTKLYKYRSSELKDAFYRYFSEDITSVLKDIKEIKRSKKTRNRTAALKSSYIKLGNIIDSLVEACSNGLISDKAYSLLRREITNFEVTARILAATTKRLKTFVAPLPSYTLGAIDQHKGSLRSAEKYAYKKEFLGLNTKELVAQRLKDQHLISLAKKQAEIEENARKLYREKNASFDSTSIEFLVVSCAAIKNKQLQQQK